MLDPLPDEQVFDREWSNYAFDQEVPSNHYARRDEGGDGPEEVQTGTERQEVWGTSIGQEAERGGTEALAWYLPVHRSIPEYGIYFRESGLLFLADYLESAGVAPLWSLYHAYQLANAHEETHFVVEAVSSFVEYFCGREVYSNKFSASPIVGKLPLSPALLEEALANAYGISREHPGKIRSLWENFSTHHQPAGYRDWSKVKWRTLYTNGLDLYFNHIGSLAGLHRGPWSPLSNWSRERSFEIPRHIIRDAPPGRGVVFGYRFDGVELEIHFANEHPPPHFHVRIPPRAGLNLRYEYPSLKPVGPDGRPLTGWQSRAIRQAIETYPRDKFEQEFERHRRIVLGKTGL